MTIADLKRAASDLRDNGEYVHPADKFKKLLDAIDAHDGDSAMKTAIERVERFVKSERRHGWDGFGCLSLSDLEAVLALAKKAAKPKRRDLPRVTRSDATWTGWQWLHTKPKKKKQKARARPSR